MRKKGTQFGIFAIENLPFGFIKSSQISTYCPVLVSLIQNYCLVMASFFQLTDDYVKENFPFLNLPSDMVKFFLSPLKKY